MRSYRFQISLRCWARDCSTTQRIAALGVQHSRKIERQLPDGRFYVSIRTKRKARESFQDHLDTLVENIWMRKESLDKINQAGGVIDLFIGLFLHKDSEFALKPLTLARLSRMGIAISFDIYLLPNTSKR